MKRKLTKTFITVYDDFEVTKTPLASMVYATSFSVVRVIPILFLCVVFAEKILTWTGKQIVPLWYKRVYLPLCKVADTPFHIQGDEITLSYIIIFTATKGGSSHKHNPGSMIIIMKMIGINQVVTVSNDVALLSIITLLHELR